MTTLALNMENDWVRTCCFEVQHSHLTTQIVVIRAVHIIVCWQGHLVRLEVCMVQGVSVNTTQQHTHSCSACGPCTCSC